MDSTAKLAQRLAPYQRRTLAQTAIRALEFLALYAAYQWLF